MIVLLLDPDIFMTDKFIEIEKVIGSKNPKLLKRLPRFALNYIKRILHEEEVNQIYAKLSAYNDYEFCEKLIEHFNITVQLTGIEHIPKDHSVIFAGNHPLGGMDAIAFISEIGHVKQNIKFIVNDLLLFIKNMEGLFAGVNKHGSTAKESLQSINDLFASDQSVFVFPAGLVSRKQKGKIMDLEWKKTFITRSIKFNKPIVPVFNDGRLSNFFYRLSNFRKFSGIKANLEMFYLADELFKQSGKTIKIKIGAPVDPSVFNNTKTPQEWAYWMKKKTYALQNQ